MLLPLLQNNLLGTAAATRHPTFERAVRIKQIPRVVSISLVLMLAVTLAGSVT